MESVSGFNQVSSKAKGFKLSRDYANAIIKSYELEIPLVGEILTLKQLMEIEEAASRKRKQSPWLTGVF